MWNPSRLLSADRLEPERLRRGLRRRAVVLVLIALVCFVVGAVNGDGKAISVGVVSLLGIPINRIVYRIDIKQLARRRSDS